MPYPQSINSHSLSANQILLLHTISCPNPLCKKIMVIVTTESDLVSAVAPARLYKAIVLDSSNFFPKALPDFVKSVEIIEGNGGPGTIKKFTLPEG